jgi:carboxypeptidase family protein
MPSASWARAAVGVALLLLSGCGGRAATATLIGTVADSRGRPLAGAAVVVGEGSTRRGVITGANGDYRFDVLPTGRIPVEVFAAGMIYDPGHNLQPLSAGANTYDVRLTTQPAGAGPRFRGGPTAQVSGSVVHLQVQIDAGPGSPVGSDLLAVDSDDGVAVQLSRSASGIASADVPRSTVRDRASWRFVGTDNACQETPTFPAAQPPN